MKTAAEHASVIKSALAEVEAIHRSLGRAVARLHKTLAEATVEHGEALGLEGEFIAAAAAPKDPPPNE